MTPLREAWVLEQLRRFTNRGTFHGKITLHCQAGEVERVTVEESLLPPGQKKHVDIPGRVY